MPIWNYIDMMVSEERISEGKAALAKYADRLATIEARYGVDRYVIVAIWGMECHYGAALEQPEARQEHHPVAGDARLFRRAAAKFGAQQLVAALKIVQRGDISLDGMTGSWAGAMGQTQFIPTTYEAYAVDFDGDGHRNIWTSSADALASTANYLAHRAGRPGETWGYEVALPRLQRPARPASRSLGAWPKLGVDARRRQGLPRPSDTASLFLPAGREGPAFLLLSNFRVIKHYNNANSYALAVGHLADRLRGFGPFADAWPDARDRRSRWRSGQQLQLLLTVRGLYSGDIDGDLGSGSREAIRLSAAARPEPGRGRDARLLQRLEAAGRTVRIGARRSRRRRT